MDYDFYPTLLLSLNAANIKEIILWKFNENKINNINNESFNFFYKYILRIINYTEIEKL